MRARSRGRNVQLPERLGEDLSELFASECESRLTWQDARDEGEHPRWFQVLLGRAGRSWRLSFTFWVPPWMHERGVRAILPARLEVAACEPGVRATAHVGAGSFADLQQRLPQAARVAGRLVQELWGATGPDDVWLREIAAHDPTSGAP